MNRHSIKATTAVIILATVAIALTATTIAALSSSRTVPITGSISAVNVGVYTDSACTQVCTSLNTGTLEAGSSVTQTVYIKNTGNVPETLTMTVNNWTPTNANTYLTLTWNRQNTQLSAGATTQATLTLTTAADCGSLTDFSCSVIITGTA
jgi:uncharacterized membrane protein